MFSKLDQIKLKQQMEYSEFLDKIEWKKKRQDILEKDRYTCTNCSNKTYFNNCEQFIIDKIDLKFYQHRKYLNIKDFSKEKYDEEVYKFSIDKNLTETYYDIEFYSTKYLIKNIELNENKNPFTKTNYKLFTKSIKDKITPFAIRNIESKDWIYVRDLHVHHKYYQLNKKPWEYPNEALTTLCWQCHEDLHKNLDIDVIDEYGNIIGSKRVCDRCYGAGIFPEYIHVQFGICFECNGHRYID